MIGALPCPNANVEILGVIQQIDFGIFGSRRALYWLLLDQLVDQPSRSPDPLLKNTVERRGNVGPSSSCAILVARLLRLDIIKSYRHNNYAEHHGADHISQQDRH